MALAAYSSYIYLVCVCGSSEERVSCVVFLDVMKRIHVWEISVVVMSNDFLSRTMGDHVHAQGNSALSCCSNYTCLAKMTTG